MKYLINIAIIIGKLVFWQEDLDKIDKEVLEKYTRKN